jgi:hypothetical protein
MVLDSTEGYAEPTYAAWARKVGPVPDFRPHTILRFTGVREMPHHVDGQPFEQTGFLEQVGHVAVDSYGDQFVLTPRMAADDTLGGFGEAIRAKREAHDATLNGLCVSLLVNNPAASDGVALFDASRSNIRTPGAAPDETELSAVRLLFRQMTDPNGRTTGRSLARLLVPSELETTTQKLLQKDLQIRPVTTATGEVFRGVVDYDVEPGLSGDSAAKWYAFASGGQAAVVYCHQTGFETVAVRQFYEPGTQALVHQFEGRFCAAVLNPQGAVRNDGGG